MLEEITYQMPFQECPQEVGESIQCPQFVRAIDRSIRQARLVYQLRIAEVVLSLYGEEISNALGTMEGFYRILYKKEGLDDHLVRLDIIVSAQSAFFTLNDLIKNFNNGSITALPDPMVEQHINSPIQLVHDLRTSLWAGTNKHRDLAATIWFTLNRIWDEGYRSDEFYIPSLRRLKRTFVVYILNVLNIDSLFSVMPQEGLEEYHAQLQDPREYIVLPQSKYAAISARAGQVIEFLPGKPKSSYAVPSVLEGLRFAIQPVTNLRLLK